MPELLALSDASRQDASVQALDLQWLTLAGQFDPVIRAELGSVAGSWVTRTTTIMLLKDQIENYARKMVENRPDQHALARMVRARKPVAIMFEDDGIVPNNQRFPLLIYRGAVDLNREEFDPGTIVDVLFEANGWGRSWRDTIYDFVHYHSQIHEVMGVARGSAVVEFGGVKGHRLRLKAGDIAIVPAGTGHRLIEASRDFLVVGAYPAEGSYDECTDTRERAEARKRIAKTRKPQSDPVYGNRGPLTTLWSAKKR